MSETGEETEQRQDGGGVASWLSTPSYAPDATENAELPWSLKPASPPPPAQPPEEHDFVVVPRDGSAPPAGSRESKKRNETSAQWSVRESEHKAEPIVIPINEALIPKPPPPPLLRRSAIALRKRWDRATSRQRLGFTVGAGAVVAGMFVGLILSSVFRPAPSPPAFSSKTYHVPQLLGGVGIAPSVSTQASALQEGLTPLAPPGAHTEVADYTDAAGNVAYELALVQDNLGHSTQRFDADLASQFPNYESQTQVNKTADGVTISCATVLSQSSAYRGCTWYNSFAFGAYIDNASPNPDAAMSTLLPALQYMANTTATRGVRAG
jgi:hypothetical protein